MTTSAKMLTTAIACAWALTTAVPAYAGFTCLGTEPFWSLAVGRGIVLNKADGGVRRYPKATLRWIGSTRLYTAKRAGLRPISVAIRVNRSCSDGMSDTVYPYAVRVSVSGEATLRGCCRKW